MGQLLYPPVEPYDQGKLDVGDGNSIYWEVCGSPQGKPAVVVHGGPGSGCTPRHRTYFDPQRYRVVLFDQRGCGRSTPSAADPATDMRFNTTQHLVADLERLREHLSIDRWLVSGASWGSTLLLAYAEQYPQCVSEIVINGVTMSRQWEIDWLYRGLRLFFPADWRRFRLGVPEADRDGDLPAAYSRLLADPDPNVRERAARDWHAWEDATISLDWNGAPGSYSDRPLAAMLSRARICAHYFGNSVFLDDGVLLRNAGNLAGIPGVLLHGRLDLGSPIETPWELTEVWPGAELVVFDESGHTGTDAVKAYKRKVLDELASWH